MNGAVCPSDFIPSIYLKLNPDVEKDYPGIFSIAHYVKFGIDEGRIYKYSQIPKEFTIEEYRRLLENDDINCKYILASNKINYEEMLYDIKPFFNKSDISNFLLIDRNTRITRNFIKNEEICENLPRMQHNLKQIIDVCFIDSCILIVDFYNGGGGTSFFIDTIISKYKKYQTFLIVRSFQNKIYFTVNDDYDILTSQNLKESTDFLYLMKDRICKIFVNHTIGHTDDFLEVLFSLKKEVTTITHDFFLFAGVPHLTFNDIDDVILKKKNSATLKLNKYNKIITQNIANLNIFGNFIEDSNKVIISPLPDFCNYDELIVTSNSKIVIGIIGCIHTFKGSKQLNEIIKFYRNKNVTVVVFGKVIDTFSYRDCYPYNNVKEFNNLLKIHKPNILLELSVWNETYSYALTLAMITQLPILYLKKTGLSVVENRLSEYNKSYEFSNLLELDALIKSYKQDYFYTISPEIYFNDFWDNYFITKMEKKFNIDNFQFKHDVNPYFIYFPQFHKIKENDVFFYENYTDITNLKKYNESNKNYLEEVNKEYLNINNVTDYNLTNEDIIQRQINLINEYNFKGFAIYYYWFSKNTLTNNHVIMTEVVNNFFSNSINLQNKKVFFIWANENWKGNAAFGNDTEYIIENEYTFENLVNNAVDLMPYFKHDNYLKIENKPVFFIYHSHLLNQIELDTLYEVFNGVCMHNSFSGIHIVLNSFDNVYENKNNFYINFNYKRSPCRKYNEKLGEWVIDYKDYINSHVNDNRIQTIVFDFNNKPRLFEPNRLSSSTIVENNTEINKIIFVKKLLETYNDKKDDLNKILLINAFNEWGERMTFEPSDKYKYYNINLLCECLQK